MKFNVKTLDTQGTYHDDVVDVADTAALYREIREKGRTLINAEEIKAPSFFPRFKISLFSNKVKMIDKITFARNLGSMIDAGLPMSRALSVMEKQTRQKYFKQVIANLNRGISQGRTLSDSMKDYENVFPTLMTSMVKAGEESGSLSQALRLVASQMDNSYHLTRKIKGAMVYPVIILVVMIIIGFFLLTYVVPVLSATFKNLHADLPLPTKIVVGVSDFLIGNLLLTIGAIVVIVVGIYLFSKTTQGKRTWHYILLHIPIIGVMTKEINSARMARTLASLLSAGVDIVVATKITADVVQNVFYKEVMAIVEQRIQKGEPMAKVFGEKQHLYPAFVEEMVSVGEETGQLSQMLLGVATFYENDIDQKTKDMSSVIEPFLMVFIGLAVGFFAVAMIMPIYSLSNNLG